LGHNLPKVNWVLTLFDVAFLKGLRIVVDPPMMIDYGEARKAQAQAKADKKQARWENYMAIPEPICPACIKADGKRTQPKTCPLCGKPRR
jgi:membrane protease subunit (stomatin/prohibitin family)